MQGTLILTLIMTCVSTLQAGAESCWSYRGALLELRENGDARKLVVRDVSESEVEGLRPGLVLFEGVKTGAWYKGRVFDYHSACVAEPPSFEVEGPVLQGPLRIELEGVHDVEFGCAPTGQQSRELIIFTYEGLC